MKRLYFFAALLLTALCLTFCALAADNVYFLESGDSLANGFAALKTTGGTIVVCDPITIPAGFSIKSYPNAKPITLTSVYDGTDYRKTRDAKLMFEVSLYPYGDLVFRDITLENGLSGFYGAVYGMGHNLTFGEGITCTLGDAATRYLSIIGGSSAAYKNRSTKIVIGSGKWQRVRGGSNQKDSDNTNYNIDWEISGGEFLEPLILASAVSTGDVRHSGNITATVTGGTFYGGLAVTGFRYTAANASAFSGNAALQIGGGTYYGSLGVGIGTAGTFSGSFDMQISGGDFTHLTDLVGPEEFLGDMTGSIRFTHGFDPTENLSAEMSYTNPIRSNGADPYLLYKDGFYYFTCTGEKQIEIGKAVSVSDLTATPRYTVLANVTNTDGAALTDLWSPEIHHFTAEEIGEENAGWYILLAANDGSGETTAAGERQYVCKCLDGDNLLGRWGDPVTGTPNVVRRVTFTNGGYNEENACGGISVIRIGGKAYITFVSDIGRGTPEFHQEIYITAFKTPWEIDGVPTAICLPTEEWEMGGYGQKGETGGWYPKVVEGASALYGENGEVYLMYTGSGYWTKYYALNYLTYTGGEDGDPLDKQNWVKNPDGPILSYNTELCGTGHGSYFADETGKQFVCYHAYPGPKATGSRVPVIEPIYADENGVRIGDGSGHPTPLSTVYAETSRDHDLLSLAHGFSAQSTGIAEALVMLRDVLNETSDNTLLDVICFLKGLAA